MNTALLSFKGREKDRILVHYRGGTERQLSCDIEDYTNHQCPAPSKQFISLSI